MSELLNSSYGEQVTVGQGIQKGCKAKGKESYCLDSSGFSVGLCEFNGQTRQAIV